MTPALRNSYHPIRSLSFHLLTPSHWYTPPSSLPFNFSQNRPGGGQGSPIFDAKARERLNRYAQNVAIQTAQTMQNLSNTTITSEVYREAVDQAIFAVNTGVDDYKSATRAIIKSIGYNGMQVRYPSGYHRRLDTAVRQNVINGANQIAQNGAIMMGEELGFDAYELSAHLMSAPDHEPVQGRVFLKDQFERMQSGQDFKDIDGHLYTGFRRPIGEWNCMHIPSPFSTKFSKRRYTDAQLARWKQSNNNGCEFEGKQYTTYQASQLMRQIETEVRRQKDTAVAAQAADDENLQIQCQRKINALVSRYDQLAGAAGIRPRRDRMIVEGFKAVKIT